MFIGPINLIHLHHFGVGLNFENYLLFNPLSTGNPLHIQDIGFYLTEVFKGIGSFLNLSHHS